MTTGEEYEALLGTVKECGWHKKKIGRAGFEATLLVSAYIDFDKPVAIGALAVLAKSRRFRCVDNSIIEGKWVGGTVVDSERGSVFNVSCSGRGMILIPKYYMLKNQSLVDYFLYVRERLPDGVTATLGKYRST